MVFSFDNNKSYFKCYDEARGVAMNKSYILKNKKITLFSYTDYMYSIFCILLILSLGILFLAPNELITLSICLLVLDFMFLIYTLISTYYMYNLRKRKSPLEVLVDQDGITNSSFYGIKMIFNWDKITGVVVKKNSVTVLTDTPIYFYFDKKQETKLIREIKKYKPKITIIKEKAKKKK